MQYFGDIFKIKGNELPPVDAITFGSPCQDLSLGGKQKGINGSKSKLFFEAIRIIKEMREVTNHEYPRFIIWENVAGVFTTNKGADFLQILESICQIYDSGVSVPKPQKWEPAGEIVGEGFSICWRTFNSKYWGVPQSRKRVYIVADFRSESARDILFKQESLRRNSFSECNQESASGSSVISSNDEEDRRINIFTNIQYGSYGEGCGPLRSSGGDVGQGTENLIVENGRVRKLTPQECARIQGFPPNWGKIEDFNPNDYDFWKAVQDTKNYKTKRDLKKWYSKLHSDTSEYKMWGNAISLPIATYIFEGMPAATVGSLFDGSGGFLLAAQLNGLIPTWSSEIEPYLIAVTKTHFK